jgi:cell wall assembly regulator SMI1
VTDLPGGDLISMLDRLAEFWRDQGAPIAGRLRPGLTDAQLDLVQSRFDVELPVEARTWWGWHDGAEPGPDPVQSYMTPHLIFLSAESSLAFASRFRAEFPDPPAHEDLLPWRRWWVPIAKAGSGAIVSLDCEDARAEQTPVVVRDWHSDEEVPEPTVPSVSALVGLWLAAFERDMWRFDDRAGRWAYDWDRVPQDWRLLRVV